MQGELRNIQLQNDCLNLLYFRILQPCLKKLLQKFWFWQADMRAHSVTERMQALFHWRVKFKSVFLYKARTHPMKSEKYRKSQLEKKIKYAFIVNSP